MNKKIFYRLPDDCGVLISTTVCLCNCCGGGGGGGCDCDGCDC